MGNITKLGTLVIGQFGAAQQIYISFSTPSFTGCKAFKGMHAVPCTELWPQLVMDKVQLRALCIP